MENLKQPTREASEMSYTDCVNELDSILRIMQSDKCDIDRLTSYTRRATELLKVCRSRLTATEEELRSILEDLTGPEQS